MCANVYDLTLRITDNPLYKGAHKLSKSVRIRVTSAVRCAIRMRSQSSDKKTAIKLLAHDIRNSLHHIFGNHQNCSDFCKANKESVSDVLQSPTDQDADDAVVDVLNSQSLFWTDGTSLTSQELSRKATNLCYSDLDKNMLEDVTVLLNRVANKSERLMENTTTNLAEAWMHVRSKFDGGKVMNLCNRGSWHARCYGAAVRQILGPQWATQIWETSTATPAGQNFKTLYERRDRALKTTTASLKKPEQQRRRLKRKMSGFSESNNKKARREYGPDALDVVDDFCKEDLEKAKEDYLKKHINISDQQVNILYQQTIEQSKSQVWISERKKRLTSSNFGQIVKRNPKIKCTAIVQNLLYSKFRGNQHTLKGQQEERNTILEYQLEKAKDGVNVTVEKMGLVLDKGNKFLGTSPDGKVTEIDTGETGLLEVKNLLHNKPFSLNDGATFQSSFCLEMHGTKLKRSHNYYFQCQGQLIITGLPWLDFVVRTVNPYQLHVERILKDTNLWNNTMLPKLKAFYLEVLLPELAATRYNKYPGIREPGLWYYSDKPIQKKRNTASKQRITKRRSKKRIECSVSDEETVDSDTYISDAVAGCSRNTGTPPTTGKKKKLQRSKQKNLTETDSTDTDKTKQLIRDEQCMKSDPQQQKTSDSSEISKRCRSTRSKQKFVGQRIQHKWFIDEACEKTQWYEGVVLQLISGKDGEESAVYEILYDGDDESYEVDDLLKDFKKSFVKFLDL